MFANCPSVHGEAFRGKGALSQAQMLTESAEAYSRLCILGSSSPRLTISPTFSVYLCIARESRVSCQNYLTSG